MTTSTTSSSTSTEKEAPYARNAKPYKIGKYLGIIAKQLQDQEQEKRERGNWVTMSLAPQDKEFLLERNSAVAIAEGSSIERILIYSLTYIESDHKHGETFFIWYWWEHRMDRLESPTYADRNKDIVEKILFQMRSGFGGLD
jgi:hypothetical protein